MKVRECHSLTDLKRTDKYNKKKTPFRRFLKYTLFTLLGLILITGGVLAYMLYQLSNVASSSQQELERGEKSDYREEAVDPVSDPVSILFLGLDSRDGELKGRTDANILTTFNPDDNSIKMVSIPRDSRVEIPGRGMDKLNHAHAFGGVDLTIETVENLFDIPVDYIVTINFDAFIEIIDTLGGVEVDVPFTFTEMDSDDTKGALTLEEGIQTLNGEEALAFVRMRKQDPRGDIGRGERQRDVIEAIIRQSTKFSTITRFNSLMDTVDRNLATNINFGKIVSMHSYAGDLNNIDSLHLEGENTRIDGLYYYKPFGESVSEISQDLKEHLEISTVPQ